MYAIAGWLELIIRAVCVLCNLWVLWNGEGGALLFIPFLRGTNPASDWNAPISKRPGHVAHVTQMTSLYPHHMRWHAWPTTVEYQKCTLRPRYSWVFRIGEWIQFTSVTCTEFAVRAFGYFIRKDSSWMNNKQHDICYDTGTYAAPG